MPVSKVFGVGKTESTADERGWASIPIPDLGDTGVNTGTLNVTFVGFGPQPVLHVVTVVVILMLMVGGWNDRGTAVVIRAVAVEIPAPLPNVRRQCLELLWTGKRAKIKIKTKQESHIPVGQSVSYTVSRIVLYTASPSFGLGASTAG